MKTSRHRYETRQMMTPRDALKEYNARISKLAKAGDRTGAIDLFRNAKDRDSFTYTAVFGAMDAKTAAKLAMTFPVDGRDAYMVCNVALKLLKEERFDGRGVDQHLEALAVLDYFRPVADRTSYTTAMACCIGANSTGVVVDLLKQMRDPDAIAYATALSAVKHDPDASLKIFSQIPVSKKTPAVYAAVQGSLVDQKDRAKAFFRTIPRHAVSPSAKVHMVKACGSDVDLAFRVLVNDGNIDDIFDDGAADPGAAEYQLAALLACCGLNGTVGDDAVRVTQLLLRGGGKVPQGARSRYYKPRRYKPRLESVNCAISALGSCGRTSQALALFEWLGVAADATSYSAAITACAHRMKPNWRKALEILAESVEKFDGTFPQVLGPAIVACERGGAPLQAAKLLRMARDKQQKKSGVIIDVACYDSAILAQKTNATANWGTAIALFREMRRLSGVAPRRQTYINLLTVLAAAQQYARADVVYAAARKRKILDHAHATEPSTTIDLHQHTRITATIALRAALRETEDRDHLLQIVVGRGKHNSYDENGELAPILQPYVLSLLKDVFGLDAALLPGNDGRIGVKVHASLAERALAAFWRATKDQPILLHPALLIAGPPPRAEEESFGETLTLPATSPGMPVRYTPDYDGRRFR